MEVSMRRFSLLLILILISLSLCTLPAEDHSAKPQTLINGPIHHGFYLAPVAKITRMDGESAFLAGGKLAWLINHRFSIGFAGYGRIDNLEWDWFHDHGIMTEQMGYGGLLLEANFLPLKILHINTGLLLGAGAVNRPAAAEYNCIDSCGNRDRHHHQKTDVFMAVEPEINLELNITRYCAIGLGIGYRFVSGIDQTLGSSNDKMSGLTSALTLKFGRL